MNFIFAAYKGGCFSRLTFRKPGEELFHFIRDFGAQAELGRYRRLDLDIDSPTVGHHLFEHGTVQITNHFKVKET